MANQPLTNFTEEQIRAKAHQIWLTRQETGKPGNADTDWQDAVHALMQENAPSNQEVTPLMKADSSLANGDSPLLKWQRMALASLQKWFPKQKLLGKSVE